MSIFSKTCEYAMRAVFYIAQRSIEGSKVGIKEIAQKVDSPEHFLAKILQDLTKKGLLNSTKGPNGGFYLDEKGWNRPLADIVEAVEGNHIFTGCGMGLQECSEKNPCPLHHEFTKVRGQINQMLKNNTIGQFSEELIKGNLKLSN